MGYFTWTVANRKPKLNRYGTDYTSDSKIRYGGPAYVFCPDGTIIAELCYEGYGIFDGKDIYELVVDWNRDYLPSLMTSLHIVPGDNEKGLCYELAHALYKRLDNECLGIVQRYVAKGCVAPYLLTDWKRVLGICIACEHNDKLPLPIKISDTPCPRKRPTYSSLLPSISCQ